MKEIRQLSIEERILMVEAIWDSIEEDAADTSSLTEEQKKELDKRLDELESGKSKTYTWNEVRTFAKE